MILYQSLFDTVLFLAAHLASLAIVSASAWVFGETVLQRLAIGRYPRRWALAGVLGWGLIAQSMFLLGVLGLLDRGLVLTLLALAHSSCFKTWRSVLEGRFGPGWFRPDISLVLGLPAALPFFALALYPPTGFDATVYHLPYARAFVEAGGLEFLADLRFPIFPQAGEMGFVLGLFLSGEIAAKLTQLLAMLLTAGLLYDWGRIQVQDKRNSRRAGTWATALWLGNPLVVWLGTSAYVDISLALFVTASLFSWERWARDGERSWLWLAGAFAGMAAGTKYLGLFFLAALGVMTALRACKTRDGRPLVALVVAALAVLAPWYLRIVYYTGNPVFPFYAPIFGSSEWASFHDQILPAAGAGSSTLWAVVESQASRIARGLSFLALVPWTAVFDRGVFHWQAPLSPYYLLLVPLCMPEALLRRHTRRLVVLVAVYGLFWLSTVRDLRFLVAGMPALNVALAATLAESKFGRSARRLRGAAMPLAAVLLLAPGVLYACYKINRQGLPPIDVEQRAAYLTRQVPGYQAIAEMNDLEGRDYTVYALYGENLRYYAEGRFLGDRFGPMKFARIEAVLGDSRALTDELEKLKACFLLVLHPRPRELMRQDPHFRQHLLEHSAGDGFALYRLPEVVCSR